MAERLKSIQVALHNQDNREHDIFDSDDYFQFHGGMAASIRALTGTQYLVLFRRQFPSRGSTGSRSEGRGFALSVPRHQSDVDREHQTARYEGGLELAAIVDYIFGLDATAQIAPDFVYEGLAEHYALSPEIREFLGAVQ